MPNSDIVIDKVKIYDLEEQKNISAIMTFANTNSGYRLKTYRYDEELFERINKLKKQYQMYLNQNNIDKLKLLETQCAKFVNKL